MKFNIKRVEIQNFRSIQDKVTLDINEGIYSIVGENLDETNSTNGCGKSSIISAIFWCLTGNTLTNEVLADEVVNISKGKDCRVFLTIDSDQGEIKILRTRKDSEFNNNLFLFINDQDLSCHKVADTQETINKLFKIPFNLLRSTIIMTSDMSSAFSELTPQQRVQTLESIRDYTVWDKVRDKANSDIKSYNKDISEKTASVNEMTGSYKTYSTLINSTQTDIKELKEEIERLNNSDELKEFENLLADLNSKLDFKKKELESAQGIQLEDLSGYTDQVNTINELYTKKKDDVRAEYNTVCEKADEEYQSKFNELHKEIDELKSKISALEYQEKDLIRQKSELEKWFNNPNCPMCGKPLTRTEEEISDKRIRLSTIENDIKMLKMTQESDRASCIEKETSTKAYYDVCLAKKQEAKTVCDTKIATLDVTANEKSKEISAQFAVKEKEQREIKAKIQNLTDEVRKIESEISKINISKASFEQKVTSIEEKLEKSEENAKKYVDEIEKIIASGKVLRQDIEGLEKKRELSDYYYKLLGTKGELRPYLLSKSISFVNQHLQKYMSYFFKNTIAELYLNGANIDILIDANGIKKSISSLSSGEAKRVNISIQLALYDLIQSTSQISFNLLFLDEIENSMDASGVQQLLNIVEDKADEGISSLFWITNNPEVMQHFNNKIICRKALGKTVVVFEGTGL